jgi:hypothetical protein
VSTIQLSSPKGRLRCTLRRKRSTSASVCGWLTCSSHAAGRCALYEILAVLGSKIGSGIHLLKHHAPCHLPHRLTASPTARQQRSVRPSDAAPAWRHGPRQDGSGPLTSRIVPGSRPSAKAGQPLAALGQSAWTTPFLALANPP